MNKVNFEGKKIGILGFGIEGKETTDFLIGKADSITVLDDKNRSEFDPKTLEMYEGRGIAFKFGKTHDLSDFDLVFRSPSILPTSDLLIQAEKDKVEVSSATKLFFDLCPCEIIGVTGTKGKGTTSSLIAEMLKESFSASIDQKNDVFLGGNIGVPPLSFLDKLTPESKVVLELSSFQLIDLTVSPHVSVMLMTTSEHLDYHKDVYEYIEAKRNIFRFQTSRDFAVVNKDYPASNESDVVGDAKTYKVSREGEIFDEGAYVKDGKMVVKMNDETKEIFDMKDLALPGRHNWENALAATVASLCAGASMDSVKSVLKSFKGLENRLEEIGVVRGVRYINDTFSTTPETAIAAIEAYDEPKILLLGGSNKNSDFSELGEAISDSDSIKAIISIGEEFARIREHLTINNEQTIVIESKTDMDEAVKEAASIAEIGDVVLLSPACASFDRYKNYKERGKAFKEAVENLRQ